MMLILDGNHCFIAFWLFFALVAHIKYIRAIHDAESESAFDAALKSVYLME
jgi:hypothetical protein